MNVQRNELVSTDKILKDLNDCFYADIFANIEERIETIDDLSVEGLADEIAVTVNFSFSSIIADYLMDTYFSDSSEELEQFVDEVVEEESPFDNELVSEDDDLWEAFLSCARKMKNKKVNS